MMVKIVHQASCTVVYVQQVQEAKIAQNTLVALAGLSSAFTASSCRNKNNGNAEKKDSCQKPNATMKRVPPRVGPPWLRFPVRLQKWWREQAKSILAKTTSNRQKKLGQGNAVRPTISLGTEGIQKSMQALLAVDMNEDQVQPSLERRGSLVQREQNTVSSKTKEDKVEEMRSFIRKRLGNGDHRSTRLQTWLDQQAPTLVDRGLEFLDILGGGGNSLVFLIKAGEEYAAFKVVPEMERNVNVRMIPNARTVVHNEQESVDNTKRKPIMYGIEMSLLEELANPPFTEILNSWKVLKNTLKFLHAQDYFHGDLSLNNIMKFEDKLVLIDANGGAHQRYQVFGTAPYMDMKQMLQKEFLPENDWWSLRMLCLESALGAYRNLLPVPFTQIALEAMQSVDQELQAFQVHVDPSRDPPSSENILEAHTKLRSKISNITEDQDTFGYVSSLFFDFLYNFETSLGFYFAEVFFTYLEWTIDCVLIFYDQLLDESKKKIQPFIRHIYHLQRSANRRREIFTKARSKRHRTRRSKISQHRREEGRYLAVVGAVK